MSLFTRALMNMNTCLGQGGAFTPLKQHRALKKKKKSECVSSGEHLLCLVSFPAAAPRCLPRPGLRGRSVSDPARAAALPTQHLSCPRACHPGCPAVPGVAGSALPRGDGLPHPSPLPSPFRWDFTRSPSEGFGLQLFFLHASGSAEKVAANG